MEEKQYVKACLCGDFIPYKMNSLCINCVEARVKISGYIGSGKIQIESNWTKKDKELYHQVKEAEKHDKISYKRIE